MWFTLKSDTVAVLPQYLR